RRLSGEELSRVVHLLERLEELVTVVRRRGIDFAEFLARRDQHGRLPLYRVVVEGEEKFFHAVADRDEFLREQKLVVVDEEMVKVQGDGQEKASEGYQRLQKNQELHEV